MAWDHHLVTNARPGRNDPCPCGSGRKYKRCCLDREEEPRVASPRDQSDLTLVIETPRGPIVRRIPNASPLRNDIEQGLAAEAATHSAAAVWGLPDFMFEPQLTSVGSGTREVGDGTLLVGDLGVAVQVKSRETPSSDPDKERRWLEKKAAEGLKQGNGSIRRLSVDPTELTNLRGASLLVDGTSYRWLVVVVLDHVDPPNDVTPPTGASKHPAVVLLRRDWEFLFDQLKSTNAVVRYLERVAGEAAPLGSEPVRYHELALADDEASPTTLSPQLVGNGTQVHSPVLPLLPAASDDLDAHLIVRTLFEDLAKTVAKRMSTSERLRVLAELDRLPVGERTGFGRFVLRAFEEVSTDDRDGIVWRLRSIRGAAGHAHLGFGACSHPHTEDIQAGFRTWVQLRHHDVLAATRDVDGLMTVGVLLTPCVRFRRPWDTTVVAVAGDFGFSAEELAELRALWPG
jgi:hypothetical protein